MAVLVLSPAVRGGAPTIDNDSGCDIALLPAATLLLPYFEVDIHAEAGRGETTIFTVTNVTNVPQIAHVTLWTDLGYPVIDFNLYLTGYDVQSINLYDVVGWGRIAPEGRGEDVSPVGRLSGELGQFDNDNPLAIEASCSGLPTDLPPRYATLMQQAFTTGKTTPVNFGQGLCEKIGNVHLNAIGYATIDVVRTCTTALPTQSRFFDDEILFDNVLVGDYLQFNGTTQTAQGGPMVHIRAIPEGGTTKTRAEDPAYQVSFPRTFYSRYQHPSKPRFDARQPLPALFSARFISGDFGKRTFLKVWREGRESGTACNAYKVNVMNMTDVVVFDEEENPATIVPGPWVPAPVLPATSLTDVEGPEFIFDSPAFHNDSGWLYLNLDYGDRDDFASQNWVISSMRAGSTYTVDIPASALGNGCSAPIGHSEAAWWDGAVIGPPPNIRR